MNLRPWMEGSHQNIFCRTSLFELRTLTKQKVCAVSTHPDSGKGYKLVLALVNSKNRDIRKHGK
jgi:hypothetical protein